jgi:enoyl-CoA hydratase
MTSSPISTGEFTRIRYDVPADRVARITLAQPESRNAQDFEMLYEIDEAFTAAGLDADIRVVILAADGPDFSSGHDLRVDLTGETLRHPRPPVVQQYTGEGSPGIEHHMALELDAYLGLALRWRDFPKPTIAQVQGRTIGGGLMLVWPCDIVIASKGASFRDPVVPMGANGCEYFVHPWEVGARKAKEMLFTGNAISAQEAHALGMVNQVVDEQDLESFTLTMAAQIATRPLFALQLAKMSVNQALDAQGQTQAVRSAFALHQIGHANNLHQHESLVIPESGSQIRDEIKAQSRGAGETM